MSITPAPTPQPMKMVLPTCPPPPPTPPPSPPQTVFSSFPRLTRSSQNGKLPRPGKVPGAPHPPPPPSPTVFLPSTASVARGEGRMTSLLHPRPLLRHGAENAPVQTCLVPPADGVRRPMAPMMMTMTTTNRWRTIPTRAVMAAAPPVVVRPRNQRQRKRRGKIFSRETAKVRCLLCMTCSSSDRLLFSTAALKCRQRKKAWLASLQAKVEFLTTENERLTNALVSSQAEISRLSALVGGAGVGPGGHEHIPMSIRSGGPGGAQPVSMNVVIPGKSHGHSVGVSVGAGGRSGYGY